MSALQELLNLGLVDIGSDDSRFEKMKASSSALVAKFEEEPSLIIPATLISLDECVDEKDPMFALVEELVVAEWKTLRNTHVNRPRELLRSIIIDALNVCMDENADVAGVIWNSAAAPLRHGQVRLGKSEPVIEGLFKNASELAEQEAVVRAGLTSIEPTKRRSRKKASQEKPSLDISAVIDETEIFPDVARSVGPNNPQSEELENPNPHWPNQNQPWAHEFSTRMATTLSKAVNLGCSRISESLSKELSGYLDKYEKQLTEQLRELEALQGEISKTHESRKMRLDVLWWSKALYSPTQKVGYSELPLSAAAVAAAVDLADIVPALAPASVFYVLGETIFRIAQIIDNSSAHQPIHSYLEDLTDSPMDFFYDLPTTSTKNERLPLVYLAREAVTGSQVSVDALRNRAGIDPSLPLSPAEFGMWVFRGLQANRIVEALR